MTASIFDISRCGLPDIESLDSSVFLNCSIPLAPPPIMEPNMTIDIPPMPAQVPELYVQTSLQLSGLTGSLYADFVEGSDGMTLQLALDLTAGSEFEGSDVTMLTDVDYDEDLGIFVKTYRTVRVATAGPPATETFATVYICP